MGNWQRVLIQDGIVSENDGFIETGLILTAGNYGSSPSLRPVSEVDGTGLGNEEHLFRRTGERLGCLPLDVVV